jgi:hypothetical protein
LRPALAGQLPFQEHGVSGLRDPPPATLTRECARLFGPFSDSR